MSKTNEPSNNSSNSKSKTVSKEEQLFLLEKARSMIAIEKQLTDVLERAAPYHSSHAANNRWTPHRPRVRPLPQTMEQVERVLAVARHYAARVSAPTGWNPQAPVLGFSVPNPLPHQLRGGALAQLQLERAQQQQVQRERLLQQQKEKEQQQLKQEQQGTTTSEAASAALQNRKTERRPDDDDEDRRDPKRREVIQHEDDVRRVAAATASHVMAPTGPPVPRVEVSMNLSDSSSDED
jgi:hypothetical protein